jgi:hypothetical protein
MMEQDSGTPLLKDRRDDEALLYDFFKHMSSLSLITLGGVLTISQAGDQDLKKSSLIVIIAFVATSGITAFMGLDEIVKARVAGTGIPTRVKLLRKICPTAFALGVGAFLYAFVRVLS